MKSNNASHYIFEALEQIAPLETSMICMYSTENKYLHPPFLRFRFKNFKKDDVIYLKIISIIENFKGNINWEIVTKIDSENYILIPSCFVYFTTLQVSHDKNIDLFQSDEHSYKQNIDFAIKDIPAIANLLNSHNNLLD